jgi:hypothetical protein
VFSIFDSFPHWMLLRHGVYVNIELLAVPAGLHSDRQSCLALDRVNGEERLALSCDEPWLVFAYDAILGTGAKL